MNDSRSSAKTTPPGNARTFRRISTAGPPTSHIDWSTSPPRSLATTCFHTSPPTSAPLSSIPTSHVSPHVSVAEQIIPLLPPSNDRSDVAGWEQRYTTSVVTGHELSIAAGIAAASPDPAARNFAFALLDVDVTVAGSTLGTDQADVVRAITVSTRRRVLRLSIGPTTSRHIDRQADRMRHPDAGIHNRMTVRIPLAQRSLSIQPARANDYVDGVATRNMQRRLLLERVARGELNLRAEDVSDVFIDRVLEASTRLADTDMSFERVEVAEGG